MSIIYTHYYFIQDILMVPVRKPIRDNPKIYFSQNPKKFFLSQCFLEIILKHFIKSKKLVQVLIKLLHPQNFFYNSGAVCKYKNHHRVQIRKMKKYIYLSHVTCASSQPASEVFPSICHSNMAEERETRVQGRLGYDWNFRGRIRARYPIPSSSTDEDCRSSLLFISYRPRVNHTFPWGQRLLYYGWPCALKTFMYGNIVSLTRFLSPSGLLHILSYISYR